MKHFNWIKFSLRKTVSKKQLYLNASAKTISSELILKHVQDSKSTHLRPLMRHLEEVKLVTDTKAINLTKCQVV